MQVLRIGSKCADVGHVQRALNECMLLPNNIYTNPPMVRLVEDDIFGAKTQAMVREFQRLNNILTDGIVGKDTSFLLWPYIAFNATLYGQGPIRGRRYNNPSPYVGVAMPIRARILQMSRHFPLLQVAHRASRGNLLAVGGDDKKDEEPVADGFGGEVSVGPGFKHEFKPWFELKSGEEEGGPSFATVSVEGTILRKWGLEFGKELEFSKTAPVNAHHDRWMWEVSIFGKYTRFKKEFGPVTIGISPIVEAIVKQGLKDNEPVKVGVAAGLEPEVSVELSKDLLELTVGAKGGVQLDIQEGNMAGGLEIAAGLRLKWEAIRFKRVKP